MEVFASESNRYIIVSDIFQIAYSWDKPPTILSFHDRTYDYNIPSTGGSIENNHQHQKSNKILGQ
jgi:hypothetical protein